MANPVSTAIGRVQPLYKGEWQNNVSYKKLDNVLYLGSTYVALQDNYGNVPDAEGSTFWQLIASKGNTGDIGSIVVNAVASNSAWGQATATGDPDNKNLTFNFGLPRGFTGDPGGFAAATATVHELGVSSSPYVNVGVSGPSSAATLSLTFGIPAGSGKVNTVDNIDAQSGNVMLYAVAFSTQDEDYFKTKYGVPSESVSAVMSQYQAQARENINAQVSGNYIVSPSNATQSQFLQYGGDSVGWIASRVDVLPTGGSDGYVLRKAGSSAMWNEAHEIPSGGSQNSILVKTSGFNYDTGWMLPINSNEIDSLF